MIMNLPAASVRGCCIWIRGKLLDDLAVEPGNLEKIKEIFSVTKKEKERGKMKPEKENRVALLTLGREKQDLAVF